MTGEESNGREEQGGRGEESGHGLEVKDAATMLRRKVADMLAEKTE